MNLVKLFALFAACMVSGFLQAENSKFPLITFSSPSATGGKIIEIANDSNQQVWAIARGKGAVLYHLQKTKWVTISLSNFPKEITPLALKKNDDGDLIGLWQENGSKKIIIISLHSGTKHRILARVEASLKNPILLPLHNGGAVVTESGPKVVTIERGGGNPAINVLDKNSFVPPKKREDGTVGKDYLPIRAFEDHHGTLWLWSHSMKSSEHLWRLRSPFMVEQGNKVFMTLPKVKDGDPISLIGPRGKDVVGIAAAGVGLFQSNIVTDKHSFSREKGLHYIERFFSVAGNQYIISTPRPSEMHVETSKTLSSHLEMHVKDFYDPEKRTSSLMIFQKGKLKLITDKLDGKPKFGWPDRPIIEQKDGFWTCINESGLAFISYVDDKTPVKLIRLDWKNGLPLKNPTQLARSRNGFLVALDKRSGSACLIPKVTSKASGPTKKLSVDILKTRSLLIEDYKGIIRGVLNDGRFVQWDNKKWKAWPVPREFNGIKNFQLGEMDGKQIWVLPTDAGSAGVFDVVTQKWKVFENISEALASEMKSGQRIEMGDYPGLAPFSSTDKPPKIAFVTQAGAIAHYDQKKWEYWKISDIGGPDARITATSFFRSDGTLIVPINNQLWELKNGKKWNQTEESGKYAEATYRRQTAKPPENSNVKNARTTIYDKHGVCWLQDQNGQIWKNLSGYGVGVLAKGEPNPISNGSTFYGICSEENGHTFIRLNFGSNPGRYLTIAPRSLPSKIDVKLKKIEGSLATIIFNEGIYLRWRIDKGEWKLADSSNRKLQIPGLLPGDHEFEAISFNGELVPSKKSVTLRFSITALTEVMVANLIAQLKNGDLDAKEKATVQLRSQGPTILPLLKAAITAKDETFTWWLKATIQRIEEDSDSKETTAPQRR